MKVALLETIPPVMVWHWSTSDNLSISKFPEKQYKYNIIDNKFVKFQNKK